MHPANNRAPSRRLLSSTTTESAACVGHYSQLMTVALENNQAFAVIELSIEGIRVHLCHTLTFGLSIIL
jgi:hypothetical protein